MDTIKQAETIYAGDLLTCINAHMASGDTSHKSNKDHFCRFIDDIQWSQGDSIFQQMNNVCHESNDQNVAKSFRIKVGNTIPTHASDYAPVDIAMLRVVTCSLFGDVNIAWTYYQTHANRQEAERIFKNSNMPPPPHSDVEPVKSNGQETSEFIDDIADDPRFFRSSDLPLPALLSNVIRAQFLKVIDKYEWNEALPFMYLSRQGPHGIFYNDRDREKGNYPYLISSSLIRDINDESRDTLLTLNEPFRGKEWKITSDKEKIIKVLVEYIQQLDFQPRVPIDPDALSRIPDNPSDNGELEDSIFEAVGIENFTEEIRLSSSEPNGFKNNYHGVRHFAKLQTQRGIPFSVSATYQDLGGAFEVLNRLGDNPCYLPLSERQIKEGEPVTQKYILLNQNVCQTMGCFNWRIVGLLLNKLNKGENIDELVKKMKKNN